MVRTKHGKRGGRAPKGHDPVLAKQIEAMAQYGTPHNEIANIIGMDRGIMEKWYRAELTRGFEVAKLGVRKKLYDKCMAGDTACIIFYCKTRLGWREKDRPTEAAPDSADAKQALAQAIREAMQSVG